jgi:putative glutamine amidotransferase
MSRRPMVALVGRRSEKVGILRFSGTIAAEAMCEAVWAGGGEPLILHAPAADPTGGLGERLARFDGVLLPGGADLNPLRYGQQPVPEVADAVDFQDTVELAVARLVIELGLPTLAVCRGMQVLNVALGGTLVQHLSPSTVDHRSSIHDVSVAPDSRLADVVGASRVSVSSYHHQSVDQIADALRPVAWADDGCVEALEHASADVLAVQWHPEDLHETSPTDLALFADLAERALAHRGSLA